MRVDSELILASLQGMNDNGDPALPIHDALVAPVRCAPQAQAKMVESFERIVGRISPCVVNIKAQKVPHMGDGASHSPGSSPFLAVAFFSLVIVRSFRI